MSVGLAVFPFTTRRHLVELKAFQRKMLQALKDKEGVGRRDSQALMQMNRMRVDLESAAPNYQEDSKGGIEEAMR